MSNVGLTTTEGIASGSSPFRDPAKRNIGLLMERERGVEGVAVKIVSLAEDQKVFGGEYPNTYGHFAVRTLFENAQDAPVTLYGVRILGAASTAASLTKTVNTRSITIRAGRRGSADRGDWGNNIKCILYSYNLKNRNAFTLEVYYKGKLVETFYETTCALLQNQINTVSDYITVSFSGELPTTQDTIVTAAGTWSVTTNPYKVVGTGTTFTTGLAVGSVLYANGQAVGKVKSIDSATALTLEAANSQYPYAGYMYSAVPLQYAAASTAIVEEFQLSGGIYAAPAESDFYPSAPSATSPSGLSILNRYDVQLIGVTEFNNLTMAQKLNEYCRNSGHKATGITILPLNASQAICELYANALQTNGKSYIAGYNVWASILDSAGNTVVVPGLGLVLGAGYIRTPYVQGDYVHIPPAGTDSVFVGVQECFPNSVDTPTLNKLTRDFTVNSVVFKENKGYYIATSRTYSTHVLYMSVHSNIMACYYVRYIDENMDFVNQKPNTPDLRTSLFTSLRTFFKDQWNVGALEKELPFEEACIIICDRSNNPLNGDRKNLNAEVQYIITEAVESTTIALNRNDGILTTKVVE